MNDKATNAPAEGEPPLASTTFQQHPLPAPPTRPNVDERSMSAEQQRGSSTGQMEVDEPVLEQGGVAATDKTSNDQAVAVEREPVASQTLTELAVN
jgi:hypothetical protein